MATQAVRPALSSPAIARQALIAGLIGGVLVDSFLALAMHRSPVAIWQYVASTIVGPQAFASASFAMLGFVVHFIVSIVWALAYAYAFGAAGQLKNWLAGAIVWGVAVDAVMQVVLAVKIAQPFGPAFVQGLLPHVVFYALPVALYMAKAASVESRRA